MYKQIIALLTAFILSLSFLLLFRHKEGDKKTKETYTLKSYRNCVALYKNEEIIEIYDDIVLNNLPPNDKAILKSGIEFNSISEVDTALQDYDG